MSTPTTDQVFCLAQQQADAIIEARRVRNPQLKCYRDARFRGLVHSLLFAYLRQDRNYREAQRRLQYLEQSAV